MTSPKTYKRYAVQWLELFDEFKEDPLKIRVVPCQTKDKARALRSEFYKARSAFLADPDMKAEYGEALDSREVLVREGDVIFEHKDNNWAGRLIAASLHKE